MLAMWVKVRVKPDARERFLKAIEVDALGSERDEPGCMRFNVLQDAHDQNSTISRGLPGREGAGGASGGAPLRGLARGRGHLGRRARGDALPDRVSCGSRVLGAEELLNHEGPFGLLVSRRFGPLFATQFLSAFNDNALRNALVLMIAYRADAAAQFSAQLMIPLAAGLFMLPFFLCSATAGQIGDEFDKARLIGLIKLIEIPVMLAAAGGVLAGSPTVLLALLFVMGIVAAFFGPLKYAILPDLLAPEELLLGNALVEAGTFIAILLGTIAGMLIAARHGSAAIAGLIVAVAFAAWAASRGIPPTRPAARGGAARWNLLAATVRVIRHAARQPGPFRSMLGISWFWLAGATYLSQFPAYVRFILGAEEVVVTLFLTLFSVGIAFGSLLCNRLLAGRLSARCVPWGAFGIGLFSIDLWLASPPPGAGRAHDSRGLSWQPAALANSRRPFRHRRLGRGFCRAALRAAAGR